MKKLYVLFSLVMVFVLVLAGYTPALAGTPEKPQPATAKICDGVKIVFFPGGDAGTPFAQRVYNGAKQAESDLGAKVDYVFSGWDQEKMVSQLKEAAAKKPDGIAIMGHPGDDAYAPIVDEAEKAGIIITSQNSQLPKLQAKYAANGFGYVGAINYKAGFDLGQEAIKRSGLKSGDKAFLWGLLSQPGRGERTKGVKDALEKGGIKVDYLEIDPAINKDASLGTPVLAGYLAKNKDVKLIVTDHGDLTGAIGIYLKAASKKPGEIFAAGFDLSQSGVEAIKSGYLQLIIDQQQYLQGYLPILQICLTKKYGFSGLQIETGSGFASKENVGILEKLVGQEVR